MYSSLSESAFSRDLTIVSDVTPIVPCGRVVCLRSCKPISLSLLMCECETPFSSRLKLLLLYLVFFERPELPGPDLGRKALNKGFIAGKQPHFTPNVTSSTFQSAMKKPAYVESEDELALRILTMRSTLAITALEKRSACIIPMTVAALLLTPGQRRMLQKDPAVLAEAS
jgi:hypothetical protein